jgi:hypothetical protein
MLWSLQGAYAAMDWDSFGTGCVLWGFRGTSAGGCDAGVPASWWRLRLLNRVAIVSAQQGRFAAAVDGWSALLRELAVPVPLALARALLEDVHGSGVMAMLRDDDGAAKPDADVTLSTAGGGGGGGGASAAVGGVAGAAHAGRPGVVSVSVGSGGGVSAEQEADGGARVLLSVREQSHTVSEAPGIVLMDAGILLPEEAAKHATREFVTLASLARAMSLRADAAEWLSQVWFSLARSLFSLSLSSI